MTYEVTLHPNGDSALVSRIDQPRCTMAFSSEREGWLCAGLAWFGQPVPRARVELIIAEAADALRRAIGGERGPAAAT
jgi:hypothetical protein